MPSISDSLNPAVSSTSTGMSDGCLQLAQRRRARRWAVISNTLDAILKAATPMFENPTSVAGASLVCNVDNTKVPGLRCLDGDFGRFQVANFADHDDVGILAQEGLQRCSKGQSSLVIDVDLIDAAG